MAQLSLSLLILLFRCQRYVAGLVTDYPELVSVESIGQTIVSTGYLEDDNIRCVV